ncbi:NAD(P)H-dependent oxidoreductase [Chelatococcus composti]|jgi:predicted homoserine dehydrogenase-like protein|uniref:Putative homoserine dehydrogenase-like protein n=1 Tax=Chelatococcus composti TaxID=1743235 RepID=A0A841K9M1_9HYPH|nr:SAF domain-containing protein [Chelatococcus composti]MBB6169558.1 putative homoserine dehydrogenase-like protein [Chelatococcus composti]GGG48691.1 homoserine dehydrogenase [Chelatococcus composti]
MDNRTPAGRASDDSLIEALLRREREGRPVRVGLIGVGQMGTDIVVQTTQMPGIEIVAAADAIVERVSEACAIAGGSVRQPKTATSPGEVAATISEGRLAVAPSYEAVCAAEGVDVVIDATGNPNVGAMVALATIAAGKHIVMMNVEADITIGSYLASKADEKGVVYTLAAGDEPCCTMELINFVRSLGYPVVAAGKGKNNPLKVDATPDAYEEEARRRNMNPRMLVEFVDGSKTMVEMVAIANAAGLVPDVPGMHGPAAPREELHKVLCPKEDGGLLSRRGVVDFSVARGVAPGVFVVAEMRHPRIRERMQDLHLGEGPYYTFYRPYHLTSIEVPLSAANAVIYGRSLMRPLPVPSAEVGAVAKRDLAVGETLDAIGEYCYRGIALSRPDAVALKALPIGLAQGAKVTRPIRKGEYLTYENCAPDESLMIAKVRKEHDAYIARLEGK